MEKSNYKCPYIYKEPEYKSLEDLNNFNINFDLDLSKEDLDNKYIFLNKEIYDLCKKYNIISENIVYYLKYKSKVKKKEAFDIFFRGSRYILLINDLDRSIEEIKEFLCFSHCLAREFFNCVYILVANNIDPLLVLKASEFMPFKRVFFYSNNYDLMKEVFKLWSSRDYVISMIEPFVYICSNKKEIESSVFKDYVEISKILCSDKINFQLENKLNLENIKNYVFKLLKDYKDLIPKDKIFYSSALYISRNYL